MLLKADADQAISDREKEQKHTRQHHLRHRSHHKKRHLLTAKIRKDENPSAFRMPNHLAARHKHHLMLAKPFWPWP